MIGQSVYYADNGPDDTGTIVAVVEEDTDYVVVHWDADETRSEHHIGELGNA